MKFEDLQKELVKRGYLRTRSAFPFLSLLAVSACGGGGGSSDGGGVTPSPEPEPVDPISYSGSVIKGPLEKAQVFLDYDGDGDLDDNEPWVLTGSDGGFTLEGNVPDVGFVAQTSSETVDKSSGEILDNVVLKAPSGSSVVTPATTIMKEAGITKEEVSKVLGLPEGVDPTSFNPYSADADPETALAVEKVSQQVMTTITAVSSAVEGAGADKAAAFSLALETVVEVVKDKAAAVQADPTAAVEVLDFSNATEIQAVTEKVSAKIEETGIATKADFDAVKADLDAAVTNVNTKITEVTDLSSEESMAAFAIATELKAQVKAAVEAKDDPSVTISFKDTAAIEEAQTEKAAEIKEKIESGEVVLSKVFKPDYTLGTSDNIQSVINTAADLNNDGEIVIALTAGRYDQNFTIDKDVSIWGSAKGLAISQDGADTEDTKVDEVSEVIFDLSDGGRGVGETWINGTVTVAHDGVTMDGLRLHNYHGPLKFEGTDIDNFTLKHSYVTGFNAPDAFKYIDTDGVKSTGWLLDGNLIGGVSGGVGGSLYLTGMENVVVSDNVFWRPGAAHMYIEDVTNADFIDNFYLQGLHADGANQDTLYSQLAAHSTWGYVGFSGNNFGTTGYGPNGYGPYGYGPNGYGPNGYGPNGYGPNGYGPNGYGPNGYGPNGYGPSGYGPDGYSSLTSVTNNQLDYYGRNYVVEVKGVTDQVTFDGNTAKFNSGGIQFWDEGDTANYFTNTLIQDNTFTDFYNADPNGLLATVESRHKSGLVGGVVVSLEDGSASEDLVIQNNKFVGSISEIYNEDDIDALILIQGEMNSVYVSGNVLEWRGDKVSDTYTSLPNDQVYTQGIYLLGDVGGSGSGVGIALQDNVFDTDITAANYISNAIVVDGRDFSSEGFGQFSSVVEINDSVQPYNFDDLFGNYLVSDQDDFNHVALVNLAESAAVQGYVIITPPDLTA